MTDASDRVAPLDLKRTISLAELDAHFDEVMEHVAKGATVRVATVENGPPTVAILPAARWEILAYWRDQAARAELAVDAAGES